MVQELIDEQLKVLETLRRKQGALTTRWQVLETLSERHVALTETELATATGQDVRSDRTALTSLVAAALVAALPQSDPPRLTYRLCAL